MKISILNPLETPDWDDLLPQGGQATFFHSSAWARVLNSSYGYRPLYFSIVENGRISGLVPVMECKSCLTGKRGVSLPFTDFCEPLVNDQNAFDRLLEEAVAYGREHGWKCLELRGGGRFLGSEPASAQHLLHTLELSADDVKVRSLFKSNTLRNIRRAEKEGVSVSITNAKQAMAEYYRLHCGTRRHHGLPPQPWSFFENLWEFVVAEGRGGVALAAQAGRTIAGAVYALFQDQIVYKFGASDRDAQPLRPNNLVMWEAIRWGCRNGSRTFHFGRTEPDNSGLSQFKRSWGASEKSINYYSFSIRDNAFMAGCAQPKSSYSFFKLMPLPMLRFAGDLLYRHVG